MPIEILMPALSPTMEEGKLAAWMVKEGDEVKSGMVLAEIETDKATMEVEAIDDGRVGKILIAAGTEGVKVNTPIAVLLEDGEDATALSAATTQTANATPTPATSTSAPAVSSPAPAPNPAATPAPVSPATAAPQQGMPQANTAARLLISPLDSCKGGDFLNRASLIISKRRG